RPAWHQTCRRSCWRRRSVRYTRSWTPCLQHGVKQCSLARWQVRHPKPSPCSVLSRKPGSGAAARHAAPATSVVIRGHYRYYGKGIACRVVWTFLQKVGIGVRFEGADDENKTPHQRAE